MKNYKEIKKLVDEKKYDEVMKLYGEKAYNNFLFDRYLDDIKYSGNKFAYYKALITHSLKLSGTTFILTILVFTLLFSIEMDEAYLKNKKENAKKYESEIEDYNSALISYVSQFDESYTDLEVFMKLYNDMWNSIDGYGKPKIDALGYLELDIPNGVGVCRNMAADLVKKLNEINPDYNARVVEISAKFNGDYKPCDVDIKRVEEDSDDSEKDFIAKFVDLLVDLRIASNHAIVFANVDGHTLMLDPTNGFLGVLKNGRIYVFNGSEVDYRIRKLAEDEFLYLDYIKLLSMFDFIGVDELDKTYGLEEQNKALERIKNN